jgi:thiol-disulfide isomerase/thioredoxin
MVVMVGLVFLSVVGVAQTPTNQPPTPQVSAYLDDDSTTDSTVILDASASSDADGTIVRYQWVFGDGATGSGEEVRHTYPRVDSFTITLLVGDDDGATQFLTQTIDISRLPIGTASPEIAATVNPTTPTVTAANLPVGSSVGQRAPSFELPELFGNGMVRLSDYLGKVVIVEFWLSTCPGCRASTPELDELQKTYADQGLVVLLVVLDRTASDAIGFLNSYEYTHFITAWESDSAARPTMHTYGVTVTPQAFLVDRAGVIRYAGHPVGLTEDLVEPWL